EAYFSGATFTQEAYFPKATFTETDFSGAIFHSEPSFTDVLGKARFSHKVAPESYSFGVNPDSPCKIEIEEQEHNGTKFIIPKGTILFDPDELSEQEDNNSNDS
uniref:pentapeptide repeat-containing protein n=1 Tax=Rothia dentocariosa TaxID=2047 RepID=UPI002447B9B6